MVSLLCVTLQGTLDFGLHLYASSTTSLHTLSRSSVEVEYRGVANIVAQTAWFHNLLRELHSPLSTVTLVYYDNVSAISSVIWLVLVRLEFYMCPLVISLPMSSLMDCLPHCLKNFDSVMARRAVYHYDSCQVEVQ
ncbi:ribonuclease H-like domain-containing protein [Tanacetum coccineum]